MTLEDLIIKEIGLADEIEELDEALQDADSFQEAFGYICTHDRLLKALRRTQRLREAAEREVEELERIYNVE